MKHKEVTARMHGLHRAWQLEAEHQERLGKLSVRQSDQAKLRAQHARDTVEALDYVIALLESSKPRR